MKLAVTEPGPFHDSHPVHHWINFRLPFPFPCGKQLSPWYHVNTDNEELWGGTGLMGHSTQHLNVSF